MKLSVLEKKLAEPVPPLGEDIRFVFDFGDLNAAIFETHFHGVMPIPTGSRVARDPDMRRLTWQSNFVAALVD